MSEIPPTSYILDAIREVFIQKNDPTRIGYDISSGVNNRTLTLSNITHEILSKSIPDYIEKEAVIAEKFGEDYTAYMLGISDIDHTSKPLQVPTLSLGDTQTILIHESATLSCTLVGGDYGDVSFTFDWFATIGPTNPLIADKTLQVTEATFSEAGTYIIRCRVTNVEQGLLLSADLVITVEEPTPSSSSSSS